MRLQRRPKRLFRFAPIGALVVVLGPAACGGGDPTGAEAQGTPPDTTLAQRTRTEGRLLASNCFQCHGTLGQGGFEEIRGESADELLEYQRKSATRDIMAAHAQGYTPEQLKKIAAYLNP
jgi:sulfide dehydrogenase cytochrome subunit